jgi:Spy/CpxP family protein refolding chaperone
MHPSVHPSVIYRWKREQFADACGVRPGCGPGPSAESFEPPPTGFEFSAGSEGGSFGVRRPLRLLSYKLELSESQVAEMARILNDLKTERAQAAVDDRRTLTSFADALGGEAFDESLARKGADLRRTAGDRLAEAVVKALGRMHKVLEPAQREKFAHLIRTGVLVL